MRLRPKRIAAGALVAPVLLAGCGHAEDGLRFVMAHRPMEISGVAALPNGVQFAVVGDETNRHGRIWPGGKTWRIAKPGIKDLESLDVAEDENVQTLWLVLGEEDRVLAEPGKGGARDKLPKAFKPVCGGRLEGLSLRRKNRQWQAVVLWEGGYFDGRKCKGNSAHAKSRIGLVQWREGRGMAMPPVPIDLDVPRPPSGRFRATDIAWHGDRLIVLLGSTGKGGGPPYAHT